MAKTERHTTRRNTEETDRRFFQGQQRVTFSNSNDMHKNPTHKKSQTTAPLAIPTCKLTHYTAIQPHYKADRCHVGTSINIRMFFIAYIYPVLSFMLQHAYIYI